MMTSKTCKNCKHWKRKTGRKAKCSIHKKTDGSPITTARSYSCVKFEEGG